MISSTVSNSALNAPSHLIQQEMEKEWVRPRIPILKGLFYLGITAKIRPLILR
jgi:hypothetical protein